MSIHRNYARLTQADREVVDAAYREVAGTFRSMNRAADNADAAERVVEAIATYLFESGGAARVGTGATHSAAIGEAHASYGA